MLRNLGRLPVLIVVAVLASAGSARAAELRGVGVVSASLESLRAMPEGVPVDERPIARYSFEVSYGLDEAGAFTGLYPPHVQSLDELLAAAKGRWRVILSLRQSSQIPETPRDPAHLEHWLAAVGQLASLAARHDVAAWEISDMVSDYGTFEDDAFMFKKTAVALKAATPNALVAWSVVDVVNHGELDFAHAFDHDPAPSTEQIEASGLLPYIDAFALDSTNPVPASQALLAARGPAVPLWIHPEALVDDHEERRPWSRLVEARVSGAPVATRYVDEGDIARAYATLLRAIPMEAEVVDDVLLSFPAEAELPQKALIVPSDLSHRVAFGPAPPEVRRLGAKVLVRIQDDAVAPRLFDPLGKHEGPLESRRLEGGVTAVELPLVDRPLVLAWDRATSPDEVEEAADVAAERTPPVEEILARHAERRAFRLRGIETWSADLVTTMRYSLGQSGRSIEVRVESRYYDRADGLKEIENLRFFIDGAPYEPKKGQPPELPLIQPEKVTIVPLEIRLDKSYEYVLQGRDNRDGRRCWRVGFKPVDADATAWQGTAWIDAETWDVLATDLVQSGLEPPILSNQQLETYGAVPWPGGEAWLVRRIDTRRVMTILGSNVVVDIDMEFGEPVVNAPTFDESLQAARDSDRQMLRDTDEGLKYLRKDESGQRIPVDAGTRKVFFIAGARYDESYASGVVPLAGVNWLESDAWGKGIQVNAFLAGAINDLTISDPSLWGSKTNLTFEAFVPLVRQTDRVRGPDDVDEDTEVAALEPRMGVSVGRPIGPFVQAAFEARVAYEAWSDTDETVSEFRVPRDTPIASAIASMEVHSHALDARVAVERSERAEWDPWGPVDAFGQATIESPAGYWRWRAGLGRVFGVGPLQTVAVDAEYLGGDDLDRFSQYEFSAFGGPQLPGFEGTGIHFDEAALARLTWSLSLFGKFGVDVRLGAGMTRNGELSAAEIADIGFESPHAGVGFGGTVPGPWRTIVRFDVGVPVYSPDYDDVAGRVTAQVLFTKLLK